MTCGSKIGEIQERRRDHELEWKIDNILSYSTEDEYYNSPYFSVTGVKFYLQIYPCGETEEDCVGWISLYLRREDDSPFRISVNFTFDVKKADGMVEKNHKGCSWTFTKTNEAFGYHKFMERSELLRRKSELAPSGALTLICSWRVNHGFDSAGGMETLSENLKDAFISKEYCDVNVKVKDETFPVHKFLLAARSPVFDAMFRADMIEKHKGVVNIDDCDPTSFKDFLMYVYSGKLQNLSSSVFELYKIGDKYQIEDLKRACVGSISSNLSEENVCDVIMLLHNFEENDLKIVAQNFFNDNFSKIIPSAAWESLLKEDYRAANEFLKNAASNVKLLE